MGSEPLTYKVHHRTTLRYDKTIQLSLNELRLRPRDRPAQRTLAFSLRTTPFAAPRARVDYFGNYVHRVDVGAPHQRLDINVDAMVESHEREPRSPDPWPGEQLELDPRLEFAMPSPRVPLSASTRALVEEWAGDDRSWQAITAIADRIPEVFQYVPGSTTVDSSIDDLLKGGTGVCQDFTHLFIALARHRGWPARYVSGYLGPTGGETNTRGMSHAWAEVCGGDGVWQGLDPTHGGRAGQHHLRLAVGRDYGDVAPHRGLFYGSAVGDAPDVVVDIERVEHQQAQRMHRGSAIGWQQQQQQQARGAVTGDI
jgi:transglutaminase-like putative cysteine protease